MHHVIKTRQSGKMSFMTRDYETLSHKIHRDRWAQIPLLL